MPTAADILAAYYADAAERLRQIILHPPSGTSAGQAFRRARAAAQLAQVRRIQQQLRQQATRVAGEAVGRAYRAGRRDAERQAVALGVVRPDSPALRGGFDQVDTAAVDLLAHDTAADLARAADSMAAGAERLLRRTSQLALSEADINRVLAGGIIDGAPRDTIRQLRDDLTRASRGQLVEVRTRTGGTMHFEPRYYARMVVTTKTREAVVTARHGRLERLGIDLVSIVGLLSNNFCTAFLGQVYSISGTHPKYPPLARLPGGGPPFHPQCSKGTRAYVEDLASDAQRAAAEGVDDARKLLGMDPAAAQRAFRDLQLRQQITPAYQRLTPIRGRKGRAEP